MSPATCCKWEDFRNFARAGPAWMGRASEDVSLGPAISDLSHKTTATIGTGTPCRKFRDHPSHSPAPAGDSHDLFPGTGRERPAGTLSDALASELQAPTGNAKPAPPQTPA